MADLTYERVLELFAETDKRIEKANIERDKRIEKANNDLDKRIEKVNSDLSKKLGEVGKKIGELGDTLGRFAEEQVKADLVSKFDQWGIPVKFYTTHAVKRDNEGQFAYEVDIVIYNTEYLIAIEVKNQLKKDDIDEHIDRMKKLQEFPLPDTKGKILLAGIASTIVGEGLDKYAESKGLFFIEPSGDTIKISNNKKTFKPREWKVD